MLRILSLILLTTYLVTCEESKETKFPGCELGWFRYKSDKCVYIFDIPAEYGEAKEYCKTAYGAALLNITSDEERMFWSFHLMRYSNLSSNVWVDKKMDRAKFPKFQLGKNTDTCVAMRSKHAKGNGKPGELLVQDCSEPAATVCEITVNKKIASKFEAKEFNPNTHYMENKRINFSNGTESELFSGVYYVLTSKFKNATFSNDVIGHGKCELEDGTKDDCKFIVSDTDLNKGFANFFIFSGVENNMFEIRRFMSDKVLVNQQDKYLSNFKCFEDGLTTLGKEICKDSLQEYNAEEKWYIDPYKNTGYFTIRNYNANMTLGAMEFKKNGNMSIGFGLYAPVDMKSDVPDKLLFKIEQLNFTLDVELYSIDFDKSLEETMASNKKQISIVDTAIINNNSPATLTHEVVSTKELTETFSTSYGESEEFMNSFQNTDEKGSSGTNSDSTSKSFTDSASDAISKQLSQSMSSSDSSNDESHQSSSNSVGASAGFSGFGASVSASYSHNSDSGSSHSNSHTTGHENSETDSKNHEESNSHTKGHENSNSSTTDHRSTNQTTNQNTKTKDKKVEKGGSRQRSYSIYKTVNIPPFSAVRISSYANWIDDLIISFKLTLKFSAKSFRRSLNGEGTNSWRTMDADFVKALLEKQKFPGKIVKKGYDYVYGQFSGNMRASIGLESVFNAKETKSFTSL